MDTEALFLFLAQTFSISKLLLFLNSKRWQVPNHHIKQVGGFFVFED